MTSYKFQITSTAGASIERYVSGETPIEAMATLAIELANSKSGVVAIDLIADGESSKTVAARKSRKPKSRSNRYEAARSEISASRDEAETLRDELQNWRDNILENMQDGEKAGQLDEAISNLEEFISNLESAEGVDVEFPRMIG